MLAILFLLASRFYAIALHLFSQKEKKEQGHKKAIYVDKKTGSPGLFKSLIHTDEISIFKLQEKFLQTETKPSMEPSFFSKSTPSGHRQELSHPEHSEPTWR